MRRGTYRKGAGHLMIKPPANDPDPIDNIAEYVKDDVTQQEVTSDIRKYLDYMIDKGLLPKEIRGGGE